jgi:signal peptidase
MKMGILAETMTAIRRVVDLALIGLILLVLFGLILGKIVPLTGHQTIIIGGGSMEPAIGLGAAIVVAPVRPADLAKGDVVSLQVGPERTTYTHRIVGVATLPDGVWIRTKGDANAEPDPSLVPATAVIGKVAWSIPYAGYLMALLSLPVGIVFVLGLAATLLAIAWLLESVESGTERPVAALAPDTSGDEPTAARAAARHPIVLGSFGDVARPTVPQQLARSRATRARRHHWMRQHGAAKGN